MKSRLQQYCLENVLFETRDAFGNFHMYGKYYDKYAGKVESKNAKEPSRFTRNCGQTYGLTPEVGKAFRQIASGEFKGDLNEILNKANGSSNIETHFKTLLTNAIKTQEASCFTPLVGMQKSLFEVLTDSAVSSALSHMTSYGDDALFCIEDGKDKHGFTRIIGDEPFRHQVIDWFEAACQFVLSNEQRDFDAFKKISSELKLRIMKECRGYAPPQNPSLSLSQKHSIAYENGYYYGQLQQSAKQKLIIAVFDHIEKITLTDSLTKSISQLSLYRTVSESTVESKEHSVAKEDPAASKAMEDEDGVEANLKVANQLLSSIIKNKFSQPQTQEAKEISDLNTGVRRMSLQ